MFKKEPLSPPSWPETTPEMLQEIGRVIVAWGVLEREIGFAIEDCLLLEEDIGQAVSANSSASGKLNLLRALVNQWGDLFDEDIHKSLDKLSSKTFDAIQRHRDFIAHGQPWAIALSEDEVTWVWAKWQAKKGGLKAHVLRMREGDFKHMADELTELVGKWHTFRDDMQEGVELLKLIRKG